MGERKKEPPSKPEAADARVPLKSRLRLKVTGALTDIMGTLSQGAQLHRLDS